MKQSRGISRLEEKNRQKLTLADKNGWQLVVKTK